MKALDLCNHFLSLADWVDPDNTVDRIIIGHPVIRVNHGTSEEPGMVTLTRYVNDNLPGVTAEHLPHGSCFRLVDHPTKKL